MVMKVLYTIIGVLLILSIVVLQSVLSILKAGSWLVSNAYECCAELAEQIFKI